MLIFAPVLQAIFSEYLFLGKYEIRGSLGMFSFSNYVASYVSFI